MQGLPILVVTQTMRHLKLDSNIVIVKQVSFICKIDTCIILNFLTPIATVVRIGFNQTSYTVTEGVDSVATVYVAVLEGGLQRMVSVSFSTEVLISDTATGESVVVHTMIISQKRMQHTTCTNSVVVQLLHTQTYPLCILGTHTFSIICFS